MYVAVSSLGNDVLFKVTGCCIVFINVNLSNTVLIVAVKAVNPRISWVALNNG